MSSQREKRSGAEWVAFVFAAVILLAVVGLIVAQIPDSDVPPAPVATITEITEREGQFFVAVDVDNRGGRAAAQVQVVATLTTDDGDVEGDQVVDSLSGGEVQELEFVFDDDPADGQLTVRVSGYLVP